MSYRAYLFDLDGTLVDTAPDLMRALNHALAEAGMAPVDEALTRHWVGHGVRAMLKAAFEHHGVCLPESRLDALEAACVGYYGSHIADHSKPYPGVVRSLEELSAAAPLAVVTNKPTGLSEELLDALALRSFFKLVVGRGSAPKPKPDAAPALLACERLGVSPADALFVGDSQPDVDCARAAGCDVVVVRHGYSHGTPPQCLGADRVIESMRDLL